MGIHRSLFRLAAAAGIVMLAWSPLGAWQGVAREGTPLQSNTTHLAVQLTTQQPFSPAPGVPERVYPVDAYYRGNDIWVAIPPLVAGYDLTGEPARVYITPHRSLFDGWQDGAGLKDCSGGFESAQLLSGTSADNYVLAWSGASALGRYDVIVDFEPFGVYNIGADLIDNAGIGGFQVLDTRATNYVLISPAVGCARIIGTQSYVGGLYEPTEEFVLQAWDNGVNGINENGGGDDVYQGTLAASWSLENFFTGGTPTGGGHDPISPDEIGRIDPNTGLFISMNRTGEGSVRATSGLWNVTAYVINSPPSWVP